MNGAPVGMFDSGVGGLSVLREIRAELPAESICYVADSANAPWGDKPPGFVRDRGLKIARFLVTLGVKAIVIGSNTGTAGSAEALRGVLTIPVVGIEPAIKPAASATKTGVVGAIVPAAVSESDRLACKRAKLDPARCGRTFAASQRLKEHSFDREKVGGDDGGGVGAYELAPGRTAAAPWPVGVGVRLAEVRCSAYCPAGRQGLAARVLPVVS